MFCRKEKMPGPAQGKQSVYDDKIAHIRPAFLGLCGIGHPRTKSGIKISQIAFIKKSGLGQDGSKSKAVRPDKIEDVIKGPRHQSMPFWGRGKRKGTNRI